MSRFHTDLSRVAISVAPSPATSGTSLGVTDANAAYLPDTYPYWATLVPVSAAPTRANSEIVKVTGGSSSAGTTTLTITRAQGIPVTTAKTVTTSFDIYDANSSEALPQVSAPVLETPSGTMNSSNATFTLSNTPTLSSLLLFLNRTLLTITEDFTISGTTLTLLTPNIPNSGDSLRASYETVSGSFSTGSSSFQPWVAPSGSINGSNATFTAPTAYVAGSLEVHRDGQLLTGGGEDFTETTPTTGVFTLTSAPVTGSRVMCKYQISISTAGNADTLDGFHASNNSETDGTLVANYGGYIVINDTLSYSSADSPTFVMSTTRDLTGVIGVGMKIKLTQTTAKYFIVTAITSSTITIYGGTDYTLANAAITSPYFSYQKAPLGFPQSPAKWKVRVTDSTDRSQVSAATSVWYNLGTTASQISLPIGVWNVYYSVNLQQGSAAVIAVFATLSTANNTESDSEMSVNVNSSAAFQGAALTKSKTITVAAKTLYYLNTSTSSGATPTIYNRNSAANGSIMIMEAICAYL